MKKRGSDLLRKERQKRKLTQDQASEFVGISQPLISMYESGKIAPGVKHACKLEKKFGIPVEAWK
jgi:transcriptional regulator with XRE-family HTH domain